MGFYLEPLGRSIMRYVEKHGDHMPNGRPAEFPVDENHWPVVLFVNHGGWQCRIIHDAAELKHCYDDGREEHWFMLAKVLCVKHCGALDAHLRRLKARG